MILYSALLLLGLCAVAADMHHYRRLLREKASRRRRHLFIAWAALTDALPLAAALAGMAIRDNTSAYMLWTMWMFWVWMVTVFPRVCYFFFNAVHLPRTGIVLGACIAFILTWGATAGRTVLKINRVEICSGRLPAGFDGLRIVQLSDIHLGTQLRPERELGRLVDSVNALHPDLVVFTGDLVNIRAAELDTTAMRVLSRLQAPVYSVTGNHDTGTYIKNATAESAAENLAQLIERQEQMGWHVLQDTTLYLHRGGDSIALSGISYDPSLHGRRHSAGVRSPNAEAAYENVPADLYDITLVHLPQLWDQIVEAGYGDLTLAGHVHSMQMKIRLFGREYSPARWLYERWSGRYDENGRTLYINDGIASVGYPMRLGSARPEITLITLKRCS
ncbi:MAG: metallophosphoesterase [Alistipes sp.]|nr:metallophosphoesterase [Alistipes senegalensis]MCM1250432.1 metallophosphoesterase [Alistipes sp.]